MSQHFLLSTAARTLSLKAVLRMSDEEAYGAFKKIRWAANDGNPICPRCGSCEAYEYRSRLIFKCKDCGAQYSVTTDTIFASRKMAHRDLLAAIAIFVNGAKGISALQLSRDLDCQYKTAFVLAHKLREAMGAQIHKHTLRGQVEIDGAYFGGYVKPANKKENRVDRRLALHRRGKRRAVVVLRERQGKTITHVFPHEGGAIEAIHSQVERGSVLYADEASCWDSLTAHYKMKRINHRIAYRDKGADTNQAESFFSRLRRAEIGTHHHISGRYLHQYANEMAWREDHRRKPNGTLYQLIAGAALAHSVSREWKGYWQRGLNRI